MSARIFLLLAASVAIVAAAPAAAFANPKPSCPKGWEVDGDAQCVSIEGHKEVPKKKPRKAKTQIDESKCNPACGPGFHCEKIEKRVWDCVPDPPAPAPTCPRGWLLDESTGKCFRQCRPQCRPGFVCVKGECLNEEATPAPEPELEPEPQLEPELEPEREPELEPEPEPQPEPELEPELEPEPEPAPEPEPEPEPEAEVKEDLCNNGLLDPGEECDPLYHDWGFCDPQSCQCKGGFVPDPDGLGRCLLPDHPLLGGYGGDKEVAAKTEEKVEPKDGPATPTPASAPAPEWQGFHTSILLGVEVLPTTSDSPIFFVGSVTFDLISPYYVGGRIEIEGGRRRVFGRDPWWAGVHGGPIGVLPLGQDAVLTASLTAGVRYLQSPFDQESNFADFWMKGEVEVVLWDYFLLRLVVGGAPDPSHPNNEGVAVGVHLGVHF